MKRETDKRRKEGAIIRSLIILISIAVFSSACTLAVKTTPSATAPIERELQRYAMGVVEKTNPYISGNIINHSSQSFDFMGKEFPFYRTPFWDKFSPAHFEILETEDEKPNCLGGLQLNYHKWVTALAREFGYKNPVEMVYYGKVFTEVLRGKLILKNAGNVDASIVRSKKRDFYSFFDYMGLNHAEFSWIAFERMYNKRWVVAMKYDPESSVDGFDYWKNNKKDLPIRVRLPMVEGFRYIPREGDIVVGLYNQTNYPRHYISHILFCVKGGDDPLFAEQFERHGYFKAFSLLMNEEFDYGFEAILRPFYPVDPERFNEFVKTPLSAYNEPIPDGSIILAPKSSIRSYLSGHLKAQAD
ncbi:MAG: hypothetical protein JW984_05730 [Deltaproteobacteria bacterium]|uniref:Uncharacterized protein n=1 Tax=Candidatus Zymogenus saltonus TaxID=2844893 RepID=A0A9D8KEL5_9DELT|nr:hypothetical protein [Candidatus Zymogenus saltonus]